MDQSNDSINNSLESNQTSELEKKVTELTRANGILKANISTLFRTAKAEISRKNQRISELQAELDDYLFKRYDIKYKQSSSSSSSRELDIKTQGNNNSSAAEQKSRNLFDLDIQN